MNPRQTVFDAKRLIGRRFDDSDVKKDMVHWPFKVVDKDGSPFIEVRHIITPSYGRLTQRAGRILERDEAILPRRNLRHGSR